jgi:hypothetical protein
MPELSQEERMRNAVQCLRYYIRDQRSLNRLLMGNFESSDEECRMAITFALDDWNSTPPLIGRATLAGHPAKNLLILGAAITAVRGAMLWHAREHMPSSDGGTSADDHAKVGEYDAILSRIQSDYEQKKGDFKVAQNIAAALTNQGVPSEYSYYYFYGEYLAW